MSMAHPGCMVDVWSMVHLLSMVQDEDATMWRLNGNFRRGWSIVHGPSNGAWSIHGPWSMFCPWSRLQDEDATMWRLNGNFCRRRGSMVHGPSNGAWAIMVHGPWSMDHFSPLAWVEQGLGQFPQTHSKKEREREKEEERKRKRQKRGIKEERKREKEREREKKTK